MTDTELRERSGTEEDRHDAPIADDPDNPWYGIPAVLLDKAARSYDLDTAGGCG